MYSRGFFYFTLLNIMLSNYLFAEHQILLLIGTILALVSIFLFFNRKEKLSIWILVSGSVFLGLFMIFLDPYLHLWDEEFHALVAKNMMKHPLHPTLIDPPVINYNFKDWANNYTWLHKQPLFMWQMAMSMKIFGVSEWAIRIPGVLMHALTSYFIFRSGKLLFRSDIGYWAAFIFTFLHFPLEMVAGTHHTDHNDSTFAFYIFASFWSWIEYQHSKNWKWAVITGVLSGCAILVKWLVGLLVFSAWGLSYLIRLKSTTKKDWIDISLGTASMLFIALPWQIYTYFKFPIETLYNFQEHHDHFSHTVAQQGGDVFYHISMLSELFVKGDAIPFILLATLITFLTPGKLRISRIGIFASVVLLYLFFALASTKMIAYTLPIIPIYCISFTASVILIIDQLKTKFKAKEQYYFIAITTVFIFFSSIAINFGEIERKHSMRYPTNNENRLVKLTEIALFKRLPGIIQEPKRSVLFLPNTFHSPVIRFYTDIQAYDYFPNGIDLELLHKKKYTIYSFGKEIAPLHMQQDASIIWLDYEELYHSLNLEEDINQMIPVLE